jgi:hypothetical protein
LLSAWSDWASPLFAVCRLPFVAWPSPLHSSHHPELFVRQDTAEFVLALPLGGHAAISDVAHGVPVPILNGAHLRALLGRERRNLLALPLHDLLAHLGASPRRGRGRRGRGLGGKRCCERQGREGQCERLHGVILDLMREPASVSRMTVYGGIR